MEKSEKRTQRRKALKLTCAQTCTDQINCRGVINTSLAKGIWWVYLTHSLCNPWNLVLGKNMWKYCSYKYVLLHFVVLTESKLLMKS